jgi:hypothetical protein
MRFLCPNHLEAMQQETEAKLAEYAVRWICLANCHRQKGGGREALAYSGCAFDVAAVMASRFPRGESYGPTLLTLGTVCLAFQLRSMGRDDQAEAIVDLGCTRLSLFTNRQSVEWRQCLQVLTQSSGWSDFTAYHLGFRLAKTEAESRPFATGQQKKRVMPAMTAAMVH